MSLPSVPIRADRIQERLERLATFTEPDRPWTRQGFTPLDGEAREWLAREARALGLEVRTDTAANLLARRHGSDGSLPPIWTGSHLDTVASGGRFDGTTGVIGALEVLHAFADAGIVTRHPLELVVFTCEEASVLGLTPFGSRAMAGQLAVDRVSGARAPHGAPLAEALRALGGDPDRLGDARIASGAVHALWELHIEQGPELEQDGVAVGAVTTIAAPSRGRVTITGRPDHAGATMMDRRRDALTAAAEVILAVERAGRQAPGTVGTVGQLTVAPNQVAVVPARVEFSVEVRAATWEAIEAAQRAVDEAVRRVATERPVEVELTWLISEPPVTIPEPLVGIVEAAARELDISCRRIISRAEHDSSRLGDLMPVGMIFVPSVDGRSHCPEEWTDYAAIAEGARVLAQAILRTDELDELTVSG